MLASLKSRLEKSVILVALLLALLPLCTWLSRGRFGIDRLGYRVYSIVPFSLSSFAARAARRTSSTVTDPSYAALHSMMRHRFDFDRVQHIDEWEDRCHDFLSYCDAVVGTDLSIELQSELLYNALVVVFHPSVHQGLAPSPFVNDQNAAERVLGHASIRLLRGEQSCMPNVTRKAPATDSAITRILVVTDTNLNFMGSIIRHWTEDPAIDLRVRDLHDEGIDPNWWSIKATIRDRLLGIPAAAPSFLEADLFWADVVYVEWSQAFAARLSTVAIPGRLVIRLHRYEAFIQTPSLTNWEQVDTLVTITPYIKVLLERTLPGISKATNVQLVPNVTDLSAFARPKQIGAERTIALVQYGSVVKDPMWALDVLTALHRKDRSWRLLFIGAAPTLDAADQQTIEYFEEFSQRVKGFGSAIDFLGHRNDLPEVFQAAGHVLSTSRVEGAPVSLLEGIASGAIPTVRDWPIVAPLGAARSLYPEHWVVDTPEAAATRILETGALEGTAIEQENYQRWACENFDSSTVMPKFTQTVASGH